MKSQKLLLALFVIYWVIVYGAGFVSSGRFGQKYKSFFPPGYKMYAPATTTNYDVVYEFYSGGDVKKAVGLARQLEDERKSSVWNDKEAFVKRRIYLESLKAFDFDYQTGLYRQFTEKTPDDFEKRVNESPYLSRIAQSLRNYVKLYAGENPGLNFDSVKISVVREPVVLVFDLSYKGDFTYTAGKGVFYTTTFKQAGK